MNVASQASQEVQAEAAEIGWIPPERFKGAPEEFIDADQYLERGRVVLPIVREKNRRLQSEMEKLKEENSRTAAALAAAQEAIEQIEIRHSVATQKAVEEARKQVKAQLAAANEAGDYESAAELTDQLTQLKVAEVAPAKKAEPAPTPVEIPKDLKEWNAENPWFGTNARKTALALGIAQELREGGEKSTGRSFFELVALEVAKTLGETSTPPDKVEGARNGSGSEARGSAKKGYAALPADAKEVCDADAKRFVGANKRYKTVQEWQTRYAELYFEGA